jgi:hypothetical protein
MFHTSVWQLAFLPSAEAYCEATPTECLPFFGTAVSSITANLTRYTIRITREPVCRLYALVALEG